ncbi:MAG: Calx-beta domain-containing protein [Pirellulaceae bacterium]
MRRSIRHRKRFSQYRRALRLEALEDRRLLSAYTFTKIADTDGPFSRLKYGETNVSINEAGDVVFMADTDVGDVGIFVGSGGETTINDYMPMALASGPFQAWDLEPEYVLLDDAGGVAFEAEDNAGNEGIYVGYGVEESLSDYRTVTGLDKPIQGGELVGGHDASVAFLTRMPDGSHRLYKSNGSELTIDDYILVADDGSSTFHVLNNTYFTNDVGDMNASGQIVFSAEIEPLNTNIYVGSGGESTIDDYVKIKDASTFSGENRFAPAAINDSGTVAFVAQPLEGSFRPLRDLGVYGGVGGETTVDDYVNYVEPGIYESIHSLAIAETDTVAFHAKVEAEPVRRAYDGRGTYTQGEGIYTGPDPIADKVIGEGDLLFGSVVKHVSFRGAGALNNSGQIAFWAELEDGTTGVFRASPSAFSSHLSISNTMVLEGDAEAVNAVFTVSLENPPGEMVTVDFSTSDGEAAGYADYEPLSGRITFDAAGPFTQNISIPVYQDQVTETPENFFVSLSNPFNATISDSRGVGLIVDGEELPPNPILVDDAAILEGSSGTALLQFPVYLLSPATDAINVDFHTADVTATAGIDYQSTSGSLVFAPGETIKTVDVLVNGDTVRELHETLSVQINATGATVADGSAVGGILDDDQPDEASRMVFTTKRKFDRVTLTHSGYSLDWWVTLEAYNAGLVDDWNGEDTIYTAIVSCENSHAREDVDVSGRVYNRMGQLASLDTNQFFGHVGVYGTPTSAGPRAGHLFSSFPYDRRVFHE